MFKVYWTSYTLFDAELTESMSFGSEQMSEALKFMNDLRQDDRVAFVVMASENPNHIGKMGVAAPSADYNWTKRRHNERDPDVAVSRRGYNANDEVEVPIDE